MNPRKDIFLKGEKVQLRPLNEKDVEGNYRYWLNDPEIVRYNSHGRFPMTPEKLLDYVRSVSHSTTMIVLAIEDAASGVHVGNISLQGINWIDRSAEIAFVLGEKDAWGRGIMYEAGQLMIRHAFDVLNLHRVHCGTSADNIGMQKLAEKLGMEKEGTRKEAIFNNGGYRDVIEFGLLNRK